MTAPRLWLCSGGWRGGVPPSRAEARTSVGWHSFFWTVGRGIVRAHSCLLNFSGPLTIFAVPRADTDGFTGGPLPEGAGQ